MRGAPSIGPGLIDEHHAGLRCRADVACREAFYCRSSERPTVAAAQRNAHELTDHGYVHVPIDLPKWGFALKARVTRQS